MIKQLKFILHIVLRMKKCIISKLFLCPSRLHKNLIQISDICGKFGQNKVCPITNYTRIIICNKICEYIYPII